MSKPATRLAALPDDGPSAGSPPPPHGLKAAGRLLWSSVLGGWEIDAWEQLLLLQACRCADRLDDLAEIASQSPVVVTTGKGDQAAHPAVVEARQQSIVLTRLLASMRLPVGDEDDLSRPQRRGGARGAYAARRVAR